MSLAIYQSTDPSTSFSTSGMLTNPFRVGLDGRFGGSVQERLYVRNDDPTLYYSGISIVPVDNGTSHIVDGTNGYSWKLHVGDQQPLDQEWATIPAGQSITISGYGGAHFGDTSTYVPFWVRVDIPTGARVNSYEDVVLRLTASGLLVT